MASNTDRAISGWFLGGCCSQLLEPKRRVTVGLHSNAELESWFGPLVVQEFLAAVALEDLHLRRISRKYPGCPGPANECVGTWHGFCPRYLRFSGIFVLRGGSGLWCALARLCDQDKFENGGWVGDVFLITSSLIAPATLRSSG